MDVKLKALYLRLKKSDGIIAKREKEAIERQRASIVALAGEIDELRGSIQEAKFIQGETEEGVESWSEDVEIHLSRADESVAKLGACVKEIDTETSDHEREHRHGKAMELEKQLLDQKLEAAIKQNEISAKTAAVKLPKLTITPFNGTAIDWVRFESQLSAMINSQSVSAVAKFSHLKELLTLGARGYFSREIEREIRGGAASARREAPRRKKLPLVTRTQNLISVHRIGTESVLAR